jgi:lipoprotein NlpI
MLITLILGSWLSVLPAYSAGDPLDDAEAALRAGKFEQAAKLASTVLDKEPKHLGALQVRGVAREMLGQYKESLADFSQVVAIDPKLADAWHQRGCVQFKLGAFKDSVKDFDRFIELNPKAKISHWQRGISHYYAGMFAEGRQQFEGYQDFDSNDVENAVWRFMCMTKADGIEKARKAILKIGNDRRVPMRQVYDLYKGDLQPADVMKAAQADARDAKTQNQQLFYAHLYLGIYFDLLGEKKAALEHLEQAVGHRIGHYMWDVARVHRDLLRK